MTLSVDVSNIGLSRSSSTDETAPPLPTASDDGVVAEAVAGNGSAEPISEAVPTVATEGLRLKKYRGGFHSSICDIFRNPARRTDCCAVACCGVLASDRTRYLLTGERPPPLWRRVALYLVIPALFVAAMDYFAVERAVPQNGDESGEGGVVKVIPAPLFWSFFAYLVFLLIYSRYKKRTTRREIITKLYTERMEACGQEVDSNQLNLYLAQQRIDTARAHASCSPCFAAPDLVADGDDMEEMANLEPDFCSCLWECLARTFWKSTCGCWCLFCGICAVAQEEREVNRLVGTESLMIDYATFQPYSEYLPAIENLRENRVRSLKQHFRAVSILSTKLLQNVAGVLLVLFFFALTNVDSNFTWENMIVLLLTLGQAFFVEYLVHWKWCRFDLSLDSVVKYFACGFLLTTPLALVFEAIISAASNTILGIAAIALFVTDEDLTAETLRGKDEAEKAMMNFMVKYQGLYIFFNFINAFVVAALIEEMVKYFGYWMVVVPDMLQQPSPVSRTCSPDPRDSDNEETQLSSLDNVNFHNKQKTTSSIGTGITVAMVSVALGFACCENLMYIFVYSPPSLGVEVSTLVARSFFPVHPLCAAIQSIGVCKRDLEGDKKYGLGRIIIPAVILHGSFDFILMLLAFLQQLEGIKSKLDDDTTSYKADGDASSTEDPEDLTTQLTGLIAGMAFVIVGAVYYVVLSRAQSSRLRAMDIVTRDQNSPLV